MTEFKFTQKADGDTLILTFDGAIDEDAGFPEINTAQFKKITIDLHSVKAINSVGIREWLDWIRPVADQAQITLMRAPKALVFQFNMVEGFLPPKATVTSFYVPYYCDKCDKEENVLFTIGKEVTAAGGAVKINFDPKKSTKCTDADCEMEMDVTESKYFQFLKRA